MGWVDRFVSDPIDAITDNKITEHPLESAAIGAGLYFGLPALMEGFGPGVIGAGIGSTDAGLAGLAGAGAEAGGLGFTADGVGSSALGSLGDGYFGSEAMSGMGGGAASGLGSAATDGMSLSSLFNQGKDWVLKNKMLTAKGLGGLYDMYAKNQMAKQLGGQLGTLNGMYMPGSPEAAAIRAQIERRDAAAGRRSQYGTREAEIAAALAGNRSRIMTSPSYMNMTAAYDNAKYGGLNSMFKLFGSELANKAASTGKTAVNSTLDSALADLGF